MRQVFYILIIASTLLSCKREKKTSNSDLVGTWRVVEAYRNDKLTKTMESAFFTFHANGAVESNIHQVQEVKKYNVENGLLKVNGKESYELQIVNLKGDTLELSGKMWFFNLKFTLVKNQ